MPFPGNWLRGNAFERYSKMPNNKLPKNKEVSLFGNTALIRQFCPSCRETNLVIAGNFNCCGRPAPDNVPLTIKRVVEPVSKRRQPGKRQQQQILTAQDYRCIYCERTFGAVVYRNSRPTLLRIEWEHLTPFSFSQDNRSSNFAAACQVCNGLKSDLHFTDIWKAKVYIAAKLDEKGYYDIPNSSLPSVQEPVPQAPAMGEILHADLPANLQRSQNHRISDGSRSCQFVESASRHIEGAHQSAQDSHPQAVQPSADIQEDLTLTAIGPPAPLYQHDEELRRWIEQLAKGTSLKQRRDIAAKIGISRTVLESYIAGTYFLPKPHGLGVKGGFRLEARLATYRTRFEREGRESPKEKRIAVPPDGARFRFYDENGHPLGTVTFEPQGNSWQVSVSYCP